MYTFVIYYLSKLVLRNYYGLEPRFMTLIKSLTKSLQVNQNQIICLVLNCFHHLYIVWTWLKLLSRSVCKKKHFVKQTHCR